MRAAGNYCVDSVFYTGIRYPRAAKLNPCSVDISRRISRDIPLVGVDNLIDDLPHKLNIVCVEFAENAIALPVFQHPQNAFYIFGPEDGTISQEIVDSADAVVYIPTSGCMNLAATVNVVLYDRLAKSTRDFSNVSANNTQIRANRDINNCLKVGS